MFRYSVPKKPNTTVYGSKAYGDASEDSSRASVFKHQVCPVSREGLSRP